MLCIEPNYIFTWIVDLSFLAWHFGHLKHLQNGRWHRLQGFHSCQLQKALCFLDLLHLKMVSIQITATSFNLQVKLRKRAKNTSRVRFCYFKSPVGGLKAYTQDLSIAAIDDGFRIFCNGNYPLKRVKSPSKRFSWSRVTPYWENLVKRSNLLYCKILLHYDQCLEDPRQKGLRKILFVFNFVAVDYNSQSFYVVNGIGDTSNSQHIWYPPRLLSVEDNTLIKQMFHGDANCGIIANVVYPKTVHMLSHAKLLT